MLTSEEKERLSKKSLDRWSEIDLAKISNGPAGWTHEYRRTLFMAACCYFGMSEQEANNLIQIGVHSLLQSDTIKLEGPILDKVKTDPDVLKVQREIVEEIKNNVDFRIEKLDPVSSASNIQLGGYRAKGEMWKQAVGFWRWPTQYRDTWEMAFNELTWAVRSTQLHRTYSADSQGKITINYHFTDTLDLRPHWGVRSWEYNAICTILGFLYHDVLGGNDQLKITTRWTTVIH